MNAEILHDALNLLPGDLIAPVDQLRTAPRKPKRTWLRYASLAACAALVIFCGLVATGGISAGSTSAPQQESAMDYFAGNGMGQNTSDSAMESGEMAPEETWAAAVSPGEGEPASTTPTGYPSEAERIYVGGSAGYSPAPGYLEGMEYPYTAVIRSREALDDWFAQYRDFYDIDTFEAGYAHLDEDYFQHHDLLLVLLEEECGYICHEPQFLSAIGGWTLIFSAHYQEEDRTEEPMQWLFVIELQKGLIEEGAAITVELDADEEAAWEEYDYIPGDEIVEAHTVPTGEDAS